MRCQHSTHLGQGLQQLLDPLHHVALHGAPRHGGSGGAASHRAALRRRQRPPVVGPHLRLHRQPNQRRQALGQRGAKPRGGMVPVQMRGAASRKQSTTIKLSLAKHHKGHKGHKNAVFSAPSGQQSCAVPVCTTTTTSSRAYGASSHLTQPVPLHPLLSARATPPAGKTWLTNPTCR